MPKRVGLALLAGLGVVTVLGILSACGDDGPAPIVVVASETPQSTATPTSAPIVAATLENPPPTATPRPKVVATIAPLAPTSIPSPTAIISPSPTPSPTTEPEPTAVPIQPSPTPVPTPTPIPPTPTPEPTPTAAPTRTPAAVLGERGNPVPFGVTAELKFSETDHWEVTVLGAERDATSIVLRENQFNDSPRDGHQFYLVTVGVKYLGTGSTTFRAGSRLKALGNGGVVYTTFGNTCGVIPDEFPYSELFTNGQLEGSECWEIASADVESLVMIVESDSSTAERAWFALPEVSNSTLPTLEATSVVQPNPTPTAIPTPTPEPTPTPRPVAEGRATPEEVDAKRLEMLALINDKREDAGLEPIVLDGNIAAQIHADGGLDGCHGSHWSLDGLKPYHRYSLAGGYQRTFTHLRWSGVCDTASDGRNSTDIDKEIAQALDDNSDMVIDPTFATVSIGLAWGQVQLAHCPAVCPRLRGF